jgi:ATP-binding protein involved in chromosome partitioning
MFRDKNVGVPILGIIENMSWFSPKAHQDEKYFLFGKGGGEQLSKKYNIPLLSQIPISETMCNSCDWGDLSDLFKEEGVKSGFDNLLDCILKSHVA